MTTPYADSNLRDQFAALNAEWCEGVDSGKFPADAAAADDLLARTEPVYAAMNAIYREHPAHRHNSDYDDLRARFGKLAASDWYQNKKETDVGFAATQHDFWLLRADMSRTPVRGCITDPHRSR